MQTLSSLTLVKLGRLLSHNYAHAKIAEDLFPQPRTDLYGLVASKWLVRYLRFGP